MVPLKSLATCLRVVNREIQYQARNAFATRQRFLTSYFRPIRVNGASQNRSRKSEEEVERVDDSLSRLGRALGTTPDLLIALEIEMEESGLPPSEILRRIVRRSFRRLPPFWPTSVGGVAARLAISLFFEAMDTAELIVAIAESAVRWTIPIRWFDFGLFEEKGRASGGNPGFLEPVTAVELREPPRNVSNLAMFFSLRLSRQNVESLVFQRIEDENEPGVVFLGDTRLSFGLARPTQPFEMPKNVPMRQIVVTAPHHGSRVNDAAYGVVRHWLNQIDILPIYVRNGGRANQKIDGFLREQYRCCARCHHCVSGGLQRAVTLRAPKKKWIWPPIKAPSCRSP